MNVCRVKLPGQTPAEAEALHSDVNQCQASGLFDGPAGRKRLTCAAQLRVHGLELHRQRDAVGKTQWRRPKSAFIA